MDVSEKDKPTTKLIDNYNKNLSKGGIYEGYAVDLGYYESNPITVENISSRLKELNEEIKVWLNIAGKNNIQVDSIIESVE